MSLRFDPETTALMDDASATPLLDALEAGPWPVFVREAKADAERQLHARNARLEREEEAGITEKEGETR